MNQESIMGMVLIATPVGDYDKRLVILTKEHGKIAAFAKGARRPNCALLACSQPFVFANFQVYQGKNSYSIVSADVSNYFETLRNDLEAIYYGMYFCEFIDYLTRENVDGTDYLKLLYQSLRALSKGTISYPLIRYIFEIRCMAINGEALSVFDCVKCGKSEPGYVLSIQAGGLVCENCSKEVHDRMEMDEATIYTLQYIIASSLDKLYTFRVSQSVLMNLKEITARYLSVYVGHTFNSLSFLENMY